jgi:ribosomal protein S1
MKIRITKAFGSTMTLPNGQDQDENFEAGQEFDGHIAKTEEDHIIFQFEDEATTVITKDQYEVVEADLTPEEDQEFTVVNGAAFDLARLEARKTDTHIPCWLCTSKEARADMVKKLKAHYLGLAGKELKDDTLLMLQADVSIQAKIEAWKRAEAFLKAERDIRHNPQAFFV